MPRACVLPAPWRAWSGAWPACPRGEPQRADRSVQVGPLTSETLLSVALRPCAGASLLLIKLYLLREVICKGLESFPNPFCQSSSHSTPFFFETH